MSGRRLSRADQALARALELKGWRVGLDGYYRHDDHRGDFTLANAYAMQHQVDTAAAEAKRDDAIKRAETGSDPEWFEAALDAVRETARALPQLTTDDVMARHTLPEPREPRAWGPVVLAARNEGLIENTYTQAPSRRASSNCRRLTVWRSLVYAGVPAMQMAEASA